MTLRGAWARIRGWHAEDAAMLLIVLASVIIAQSGFNRYGASWDESQDFGYARLSLSAYSGASPDWASLGEGDFVELHGPAFLMASQLLTDASGAIRPGWPKFESRHFNNHLFFLLGLTSLYLLTMRITGRRAALLAALLMATQPLLFGHSFINQKDIPFMAMFLAAAASGLALASQPSRTTGSIPGAHPLQSERWAGLISSARQDWQLSGWRTKLVVVALLLAAALVLAWILVLNEAFLQALQSAITRAHAGSGPVLISRLFHWLAENASTTPTAQYVAKVTRIYERLRPIVALLGISLAGLALRWAFPSVRLPARVRWTLVGGGRPDLALALRLVAAGTLMGVAISVRSLGAFAGVLVTLVMLRRRQLPLSMVVAYWAVAAIACVATWPYLWADPVRRALDSLRIMAAFPWQGDILYAGRLWDAGSTPWHYLPFTILVQLTVPATILALVGIGAVVQDLKQRKLDWLTPILLLLWVGVPLAAAIGMQSVVYDNARQFLFALPPLFVFAGIGLAWISQRIRSRVIAAVVVTLALSPGVIGIIRLHPYEYTYFNSLVGGTRGAFRSYETDYWCTSMREGMDRIGAIAPEGAVVAVSKPYFSAEEVARPDLTVRRIQDGKDPRLDGVDFGLTCTRANADMAFYPSFPPTGEIVAGGAALAVIKDFGRPTP